MKNKDLLLKAAVCLLLIPCFVVPFVVMFTSKTILGSTTTVTGEYGIFADFTDLASKYDIAYNNTLSTFWMVLVSILVVVLAVLALCYIAMFVMELAKVKCKNLQKLQKFVSVLVTVCAIVALVSAIIAVCANTASNSASTAKLSFAVGSWLLIAPVLAGVVGLLPSCKKAKKSSKKK